MTDTALVPAGPVLPSPETLQHVLLGGDLAELTPVQRVSYYRAVCDSLGLNPLTRPFDYLRLSGRELLYARKDAAEQLRQKHHVSVVIARGERVDDLYLVWVDARLPNGRQDSDLGAVDLANSKGEQRANLMMKCVTKAKRRATLSICGLGLLDETEVATLPGATPLNFNPETGEVHEAAAPARLADGRKISRAQVRKLFAVSREHGWTVEELRRLLLEKYSVHRSTDVSVAVFDRILSDLARGPRTVNSDAETGHANQDLEIP